MSKDNFIDKSIDTINGIGNKYDEHIKEKAIKEVDRTLSLHNLNAEDIEEDDYEAMVSEEISKIKENYSSNIAKVGFSLLGLDLLLGW